MYDPYAEFETGILDNGLTVHVLHDQKKDFVHVSALIHSGSWSDPDAHVGLAHFVEHMVCANDSLDLTGVLNWYKSEGGSFGAFTSAFSTSFQFLSPLGITAFDDFLKHLKRMCFDTKLAAHLEKERSIILREHDQGIPAEDTYRRQCDAQAQAFIGTPHARSLTALGTRQNITDISLKDVQTFREEMHVPGNMSIVCVGGLSLSDLLVRLRRAGFESVHAVGRVRQTFAPLKTFQQPSVQNFEFPRKEVSQAASGGQCTLGRVVMCDGTVPAEAAEIYTAMVSELLMDTLRERLHLVYSAGAGFHPWGVFQEISLGAKAFPEMRFGEVKDCIDDILSSIALREDLFLKHQTHRMVSHRIHDVSMKRIFNVALSELSRRGSIQTLGAMREEAATVTFDTVLRIADAVSGTRSVTTIHYH